jgi:hypothetical protein
VLREASISELSSKNIPRNSRILVNRGRGHDELAPSKELFEDFTAKKKSLEREFGRGSAEAHNDAFVDARFQERFRRQIESDGLAMAQLEKIAHRSVAEDLYLVCYEGPGKACHRRILMRIAAQRFGAEIEIAGVEPS